MKKILILMLTIFLSLGSVSYAGTIKKTTAEGEVIKFRTKRGMPEPVKNDWVDITVAGFTVYTGGDEGPPSLNWTFAFNSKIDNISSVKVYDVTGDSIYLLAEDNNVAIDGKEWFQKVDEPTPITRDRFPWLYDKKDSHLIYKFVINNKDGDERVLHQLSMYPRELDKSLSKFLPK